MDFQVILSDLFISDLKEIVDYLADRAGRDVAFRIGNELLDEALTIGGNPFVGQPVRQRQGTRKILRYSYLIYYHVDEARFTVEILRAWHGARDFNALFPGTN